MLATNQGGIAAQQATATTIADSQYDSTVKLVFSKDGRVLREIREVSSEDENHFSRVHAITYAASTGEINQVWKLQPYTRLYSASTDGRLAIIFLDTPNRDEHGHPLLLDTQTGQTWDIPAEWLDSDDPRSVTTISGDGRLVSICSFSGSSDTPMLVNIYDWRTKKLVASQMSELFSAGGIFGGGLTEDGKIEFWNNRVGSKIVEPKTDRSIVEFGPNAVRSPNGRWIVELAGYLHGRERLDTTVINGENGELLGKLDLKIRDQPAVSWSGVFCGTTGRFIAWDADSVLVFDIPSRKQIATIPVETWRDQSLATTDVGCSWNGKRVAIRSGQRLTLHDLK